MFPTPTFVWSLLLLLTCAQLSAIDHSAILTCINPKALFYEYGLDPAALATSLALTLRDFPTLCGRLATAGSSGSSGASTGSSGSSGARASGGTAGTGLGMRIGGWPSQSQSQPQGGATSAAVAGQQLWQVKTSDDGSSGSSRRSRGGTLLPSRKGKSSVADIRAMGKHRRDMAYRIVLCNAGGLHPLFVWLWDWDAAPALTHGMFGYRCVILFMCCAALRCS